MGKHYNILKPTKQKAFNKKVYGFDIETYNNNKDFLLCSIYSDDYIRTYHTKEEFINDIKLNPKFKNSVIFATNLSFDFFGMFFDKGDIQNFKTLFRGSDLLHARTYINNLNEFTAFPHNPETKSKKYYPSITFLDTMNYAKLSVKKMGKIIGHDKFTTPEFIGQKPKNEEELKEMIDYNIQDSKVTYLFAKFLIKAFEELGATFKNTLASTSMSLFKNVYLKEDFIRQDQDVLLEQFKGYYGGRTEALKRGYFTDYNYYDFNSLYPSVMALNEFPNPNSLRVTRQNTIKYIKKYHGVSHVKVYVPESQKYPLLPVREENGKVIFPVGTFEGWYSHIELREAINDGVVIMEVYKTHYFKENCEPFKDYVTDLYNKRLEYKKENNPMEYVTKIMMNSLYGKFGQRFTDKDNWTPLNAISKKQLDTFSSFEIHGEFIRTISKTTKPSTFCIPIWALYVTAYGRIKLWKAIRETEPVYCDTDSLITKKELPNNLNLGELKLEMKISEGVIVRPKFYALREPNTDEFCEGYVKIKGLGKRLTYLEFWGFLQKPSITYDKFTKFKEAIRRNLIPNEIIKVTKELSLEDEKRIWNEPFNEQILQDSKPITIKNEISN